MEKSTLHKTAGTGQNWTTQPNKQPVQVPNETPRQIGAATLRAARNRADPFANADRSGGDPALNGTPTSHEDVPILTERKPGKTKKLKVVGKTTSEKRIERVAKATTAAAEETQALSANPKTPTKSRFGFLLKQKSESKLTKIKKSEPPLIKAASATGELDKAREVLRAMKADILLKTPEEMIKAIADGEPPELLVVLHAAAKKSYAIDTLTFVRNAELYRRALSHESTEDPSPDLISHWRSEIASSLPTLNLDSIDGFSDAFNSGSADIILPALASALKLMGPGHDEEGAGPLVSLWHKLIPEMADA